MENTTKISNEKTTRMNALYCILVLKKYSSATHPLKISEISDYVNNDYLRTTYGAAVPIDSGTIGRILESLYEDANFAFKNEDMDFYEDVCNLGFNLYCVMKGEKGTWQTYEKPAKGKGPTKYYYYESVFSDKELITLIDSVETYNYFSTEDIAGLVSKLLALRPQSDVLDRYYTPEGTRLKDEASMVLCNVDEFSHIIKEQKFAEIVYCNYDHNHELVPRDGYPRVIRPLSMMWSNGYYYLVALLGPGYTPANLRMDRITEIEAVIPTDEMKDAFQIDMNLDVSTYRMNHPVMHGGKIQAISMLYLDTQQNGMTNAIMDTFGRATRIRPASPEYLQKHLPLSAMVPPEVGTWMRVTFNATTAGTKLFATQYCRYCKVIAPETLAEEIKDNLHQGLRLYS